MFVFEPSFSFSEYDFFSHIDSSIVTTWTFTLWNTITITIFINNSSVCTNTTRTTVTQTCGIIRVYIWISASFRAIAGTFFKYSVGWTIVKFSIAKTKSSLREKSSKRYTSNRLFSRTCLCNQLNNEEGEIFGLVYFELHKFVQSIPRPTIY